MAFEWRAAWSRRNSLAAVALFTGSTVEWRRRGERKGREEERRVRSLEGNVYVYIFMDRSKKKNLTGCLQYRK